MAKDTHRFRHDSLQDSKTVKSLLDAMAKGFAKGELNLSDDNGALVLEPNGLVTVRLKAEREDGQCRLDFRVTWTDAAGAATEKSAPRIKS